MASFRKDTEFILHLLLGDTLQVIALYSIVIRCGLIQLTFPEAKRFLVLPPTSG